MARSFQSRPRPRTRRRTTTWSDGPKSTLTGQVLASTGKSIWATGFAVAAGTSLTLVRTRGEILLQLDLATAAGDGFLGAIGLGIVSGDAFGIGSTAMPGPFSDPGWPGWWWHQYFSVRGVAAQSAGADVARNANSDLRIDIDSKAMRIVKENESMFGMVEIGAELGTASLTYLGQTRVLLKLP